jgi:hypothetical protein
MIDDSSISMDGKTPLHITVLIGLASRYDNTAKLDAMINSSSINSLPAINLLSQTRGVSLWKRE